MESTAAGPADIDEYIQAFPLEIQVMLESLRQAIREAAPDAQETISYRMPAFGQNGVLVYFAAHQGHIGFYPTASGIEAFQGRLAGYESSKGAIRFPLDAPLPLDLVREIVRFRVQENLQKKRRKK